MRNDLSLFFRTFSFGEYGPLPPPVNRELAAACYNAKSSCTASPSMDASFQPIQDDEPPISGDLGYDMYPPDYSVEPRFAVRQATEFAEIALRCHNDDPSNDVCMYIYKPPFIDVLSVDKPVIDHYRIDFQVTCFVLCAYI
jgi:hypothetical protein